MISSNGIVRFHLIEPFNFPGRRRMKDAIARLMEEEQKSFLSLDYIFCSDEYLLEINQAYLQHNDLTDIITFDLSEHRDSIIGEIYISVERVKDNAHLYNTTFPNELARVIFHGALHLSGYGDKTAAEQARMREKEDYYLETLLDVPRGT